jgi:hypothetical protein
MDKNTFGDFPSAVNLAQILAEINDKKLTEQVGRRISKICARLNKISEIEDRVQRKWILEMFWRDFLWSASNRHWPENVHSHARTVITTFYRKHLENCKK